jgi:hypothetical protein
VWRHDTAIAIDGLAATGHGPVAADLPGGLLAAARQFDDRLSGAVRRLAAQLRPADGLPGGVETDAGSRDQSRVVPIRPFTDGSPRPSE